MLEFTGERVVPGLVDPNLLNEHLARYRFTAHFIAGGPPGMRVLDAGCGSGYGSAELAGAAADVGNVVSNVVANVVGIDISGDAVQYARSTFGGPRNTFLQASCETLPFADASFDLIAAFEVIEHLERWPDFLREARRVLRPSGVLLVSTPNKAYYTESRAAAGPNPYHVHEFEYGEFQTALLEVFPEVRLWSQNHAAAIAFLPDTRAAGYLDAPAEPARDQALFFLAACSGLPLRESQAFAWLPQAGNILLERERHISLLEGELAQKNSWLQRMEETHAALNRDHTALLAELQHRNEWAASLDKRLTEAATVISTLQGELKAAHDGYRGQLDVLEREATTRLAWARDLEAQIGDLGSQLERGRGEITRMNLELVARAEWAQALDAQLLLERETAQASLARAADLTSQLEGRLRELSQSRWVRLGRQLGLAPAGSSDAELTAKQ